MPVFKSKIREIMEEKKLTTRNIAERAGISKQTLLTARTDEGIAECRLSTLGKIGSALGVKTKRLYEETDGKEGEEEERAKQSRAQ